MQEIARRQSVQEIAPTSSERGIVIGQTGAGKTYFMRYLLADVKRLVVLDPKGMLRGDTASGGDWYLEDWSARTVKALRRDVPFRARVPSPMSGGWGPYLTDVYRYGNCLLYIDEMMGVVPPGRRPPDALNAIYTRGRELGIGAWSSSQRPAWIPLEVISEAQWFVLFRVLLEQDRARMAAFMGPEVIEPIEDDFGFWVYHVSWRQPVYVPGLEVSKEGSARGRTRLRQRVS